VARLRRAALPVAVQIRDLLHHRADRLPGEPRLRLIAITAVRTHGRPLRSLEKLARVVGRPHRLLGPHGLHFYAADVLGRHARLGPRRAAAQHHPGIRGRLTRFGRLVRDYGSGRLEAGFGGGGGAVRGDPLAQAAALQGVDVTSLAVLVERDEERLRLGLERERARERRGARGQRRRRLQRIHHQAVVDHRGAGATRREAGRPGVMETPRAEHAAVKVGRRGGQAAARLEAAVLVRREPALAVGGARVAMAIALVREDALGAAVVLALRAVLEQELVVALVGQNAFTRPARRPAVPEEETRAAVPVQLVRMTHVRQNALLRIEQIVLAAVAGDARAPAPLQVRARVLDRAEYLVIAHASPRRLSESARRLQRVRAETAPVTVTVSLIRFLLDRLQNGLGRLGLLLLLHRRRGDIIEVNVETARARFGHSPGFVHVGGGRYELFADGRLRERDNFPVWGSVGQRRVEVSEAERVGSRPLGRRPAV